MRNKYIDIYTEDKYKEARDVYQYMGLKISKEAEMV